MITMLILLSYFYASGYSKMPLFDDSMQRSKYIDTINSPKHFDHIKISGIDLYDFFKKLYIKNNSDFLPYKKDVKIPKIIHQIWIGGEVPPEFADYIASIKKHHPDWHYKLWTQRDIPGFNFQNIDLINKSRNPGEISDMMRYEILYRYGGVYLDLDFESLKSLEALHHIFDFYIGIQPLDSEVVQLGIGIIGSIPSHPMLKKVIDGIAENWDHNQHMATARTGPLYFTKMFYRHADKDNLIDIALPASFFYPLGCCEYEIDREKWLHHGAYAVHHWAKSWLIPDFRRTEFRSIKNY